MHDKKIAHDKKVAHINKACQLLLVAKLCMTLGITLGINKRAKKERPEGGWL
jgi:hypothetical protein